MIDPQTLKKYRLEPSDMTIPMPVYVEAMTQYLRRKQVPGFTSAATNPQFVLDGTQWGITWSPQFDSFRVDKCEGFSEEMQVAPTERKETNDAYIAAKMKLDDAKSRLNRAEAALVNETKPIKDGGNQGTGEEAQLIIDGIKEEIKEYSAEAAETLKAYNEAARDRCTRSTAQLDVAFLEKMLSSGVKVHTFIRVPVEDDEA